MSYGRDRDRGGDRGGDRYGGRAVFVGNLPDNIKEREVEDLFYKFGESRALRTPCSVLWLPIAAGSWIRILAPACGTCSVHISHLR